MIGQKATVLCVYEILKKFSDENHRITTAKIQEKLKLIYDIDMERRTVYRNIDALRSVGIDIQDYNDNREGYCLVDRDFELAEIRLLCDAVAASDMIRDEAGKKIIRKLIDTQSIFQGRMLQRTIYVKDGNAGQNHQIFYNIDTLNIAISQNTKIIAKYEDWMKNSSRGEEKTIIIMSPYATVWVDGQYYVIGMLENEDVLSHVRIDLLKDIQIMDRQGEMFFGGFHPLTYAEHYILNKEEPIFSYELECSRKLLQDVLDKFGKNIQILQETDQRIRMRVKTNHSRISEWVYAHLLDCEVLAPREFRDEVQIYVEEAYKKYWR